MTWRIVTPEAMYQRIEDTDTTQNLALGTIALAEDTTYGAGEFIYLLGVASTVIGSLVSYNALTGATTLIANTANQGGPVAVAMSANVALGYGWYMITGAAVMKKTAVAVSPGVKIFISATAGRIMPTAASGKSILGARTANATTVTSTTSTVVVTISRPSAIGSVV